MIRRVDLILDESQRDLYYIEFRPFGSPFGEMQRLIAGVPLGTKEERENPPGRTEITNWLSVHLPHCAYGPLAPSPLTGVLYGGINGPIWVDFAEADAALFSKIWEDDSGESIDPRFQCYRITYYPSPPRLAACRSRC